jgi:hypothetical protein
MKGREAKPGDTLQAGPLKYIRVKVRGRSQGVGYRKLKQLVGPEHVAGIIGIFTKFLEIAGDQPRELRGQLLNEKDKPASIQDLAFILDIPEGQIAMAIKALSDEKIGWIHNTEEIKSNITKENIIKAFQEFPETPGNIPKMPICIHSGNSDQISEIIEVWFTAKGRPNILTVPPQQSAEAYEVAEKYCLDPGKGHNWCLAAIKDCGLKATTLKQCFFLYSKASDQDSSAQEKQQKDKEWENEIKRTKKQIAQMQGNPF